MSDHIYRESHFLLLSVCMGVVIALFYDCLRIWRRVVVHGSFWTAMEDLVYWIIVSVMVFGMLYYENNGTFRWFAVLGAGMGMSVYRWLLGRFLVEWLSRFLLWLKHLLGCFFRWILTPWRAAGNFCRKKVNVYRRRLKRRGRTLKKRLTVQLRLFKIEMRTRCRKVEQEQEYGQKKNRHQKEKTE